MPNPFSTDVDFSESRSVEINVVGWVFTGIAIAAVGLKLFTRGHIVKKLGWDDFFIFFSMGLSIIATAFVSYSVTLGLGRHSGAVVAEHGWERYVQTAKWQIIAFPFNIGSFSFPNISIAILINNLLDPNALRANALYAMSIMQVIFAMISAILVFVQCSPTRMLWDPTTPGTCWSPAVFDDFTYWVSAYTTVTDIILALVPISVFWKLQMRVSTKVAVCIMMSLTLLSAVVTIVKATYLHLFTDHTDPLYNVVPLVLWGLIEQNVVIVAACIPTLRPFFRRIFGNKGSETNSSNMNSGSAFKLSSSAAQSATRRPESESELPLDEPHHRASDGERHGTQQGIWQTREFKVESDEENDLESEVHRKQQGVM